MFERRPDGILPTELTLQIVPRIEHALLLLGTERATSAQIRAFIALVQSGSYASAAASTSLAPATLHRSVTELELTLGRKLTRRRGRGIEVTRTGQAVARQLRLAGAEIQAAMNEIAAFRGSQESRIVVGAMPLCRARFLPDSIIEFQKSSPQTGIQIREGAFTELVEPLRDGDIDILIGAIREHDPGPDVEQTPLFQDRLVIVAGRDHPLADKQAPPSLTDLSLFPWVVPQSGVPLRERWERMFTHAGLALPSVSVESGSVIIIRQMLRETSCLTVISPDQVSLEIEVGSLSIISDMVPENTRTIGLITRRDWRPTNTQSAFIDVLKTASRISR